MVNLNLCCGSIMIAGATNIDVVGPCDLQCDIRHGIPADNDSVDKITCYHGIEHFEYPVEVDHLLIEICRVLKPNGQFVLTTPDLIRVVDAMRSDGGLSDLTKAWPSYHYLLFGTHETPYQVHRWLYTEQTLYYVLRRFFGGVDISLNRDDHNGPGLQANCTHPSKKPRRI